MNGKARVALRREKLQLLETFLSSVCPCGAKKNPEHWVCISCGLAMRNTEVEKELYDACENHLRKVQKFISAVVTRRELNA